MLIAVAHESSVCDSMLEGLMCCELKRGEVIIVWVGRASGRSLLNMLMSMACTRECVYGGYADVLWHSMGRVWYPNSAAQMTNHFAFSYSRQTIGVRVSMNEVEMGLSCRMICDFGGWGLTPIHTK